MFISREQANALIIGLEKIDVPRPLTRDLLAGLVKQMGGTIKRVVVSKLDKGVFFGTMSVTERVQIVEDLWDSIVRSNANLPVPQWQKDELARRKKRYQQNPDTGETWDQVERSILQQR